MGAPASRMVCRHNNHYPRCREHFLTPSTRRHTHPFGGLGVRMVDTGRPRCPISFHSGAGRISGWQLLTWIRHLESVKAGWPVACADRSVNGGASSPWPAASPCTSPSAGLGKPSSLAPSPDCAPCRSPPDRDAGNRPTTLFPLQPVSQRSLHLAPHRWASESSFLPSAPPCAAPFADNRPTTGASHPKSVSTIPSPSLSCPVPVPPCIPSVDSG